MADASSLQARPCEVPLRDIVVTVKGMVTEQLTTKLAEILQTDIAKINNSVKIIKEFQRESAEMLSKGEDLNSSCDSDVIITDVIPAPVRVIVKTKDNAKMSPSKVSLSSIAGLASTSSATSPVKPVSIKEVLKMTERQLLKETAKGMSPAQSSSMLPIETKSEPVADELRRCGEVEKQKANPKSLKPGPLSKKKVSLVKPDSVPQESGKSTKPIPAASQTLPGKATSLVKPKLSLKLKLTSSPLKSGKTLVNKPSHTPRSPAKANIFDVDMLQRLISPVRSVASSPQKSPRVCPNDHISPGNSADNKLSPEMTTALLTGERKHKISLGAEESPKKHKPSTSNDEGETLHGLSNEVFQEKILRKKEIIQSLKLKLKAEKEEKNKLMEASDRKLEEAYDRVASLQQELTNLRNEQSERNNYAAQPSDSAISTRSVESQCQLQSNTVDSHREKEKEMAGLYNVIEQLNKDVQDREEIIRKKSEEAEGLKTQISELKQVNGQLTASLTDCDKDYAAQRDQNALLKTERNNLQNAVMKLTKDKKDQDDQLAAANEEIKRLSKASQQSVKVVETPAGVDKKPEPIDSCTGCANLQNAVMKLTKDKKDLDDQLAAANGEIKCLSTASQQSAKVIAGDDKEPEPIDSCTGCANLRRSLTHTEGQLKIARRECIDRGEIIGELRKSSEQRAPETSPDISQLEKELVEALTRKEMLEGEMAFLNGKRIELECENEHFRQQVENLKSEVIRLIINQDVPLKLVECRYSKELENLNRQIDKLKNQGRSSTG